jgi:hypothetical protein
MNRETPTYHEYFQWFDVDDMGHTRWPILGERILDPFTFSEAVKLGPALIYERPIRGQSECGLSRYFSENSSVVFDTTTRASIAAQPGFVWPSDEEYVAGFLEIYGAEFLATLSGARDTVWDEAA